jgi:hypothetical protein
MEFLFTDPDVPRLPPAETRLIELHADPYPDGKRLRVTLELTPFQKRPNLELTLTAPDASPCASASIIEPVGWQLELTLHIRAETPLPGTYLLSAHLLYPELGEVDHREIKLEIPGGET